VRAVAIIQARCGSTRLPGKILQPLGDHTVLYYVIERCRLATTLADVVVATTDAAEDDRVVQYCDSLGVRVFRGSEADVLLRYVGAADWAKADPVVRITSDCPLIEPAVIDDTVRGYAKTGADYVYVQGYPRGTGDAEVCSVSALARSLRETRVDEARYREHVVTYLLDHPEKFRLHIPDAPAELRRSGVRLCVDEPADLEVIRAICAHFSPRLDFRLAQTLAFLAEHSAVAALNRHVRQKNP
jgi:spore coat polysaccharide biosynthesis protein SpsF (cytidylyltransferase family)